MENPAPADPALQKGMKKAPTGLSKNPPTARKKPPPPRETPTPAAKASLIGSASCLELMKTPSQPIRHPPTNRKEPPLLREWPETRAISHLDKPMGKPTPANLPSHKKPERAPNLPGGRLPMGRRRRRFLVRRPRTGSTNPPGGWRKRLALAEPVSHKSPEKPLAPQSKGLLVDRKALPFLPAMPGERWHPAYPAQAKNLGRRPSRQGRHPPEN